MRFRLYCFRENIITFWRFIKSIRTFYKFWCDYEFNGEDCGFIIEQYTKILCNRTRLMSKPTYYAEDVIQQIDNWYEEMLENDR